MERVLAPVGFGSLMPYMVRDILLVASAYDCFILEEDGRFSDRLLQQYVELELSSPPHFQHVTSSKKALELMRKRHFDLVLCTPHCVGLSPDKLAARIHEKHPGTPVALLTHDRAEALRYAHSNLSAHMEHVFLWTGDPKLLVGLVKAVEDVRNAPHDTSTRGVRVVIVVEDDPAFYSSFIPELYSEMLRQCHALVPDRLNERDRRFRMRARPKILLARDYETALKLFNRYKKFMLGLFCDMRFPRKGKLNPKSGHILVRKVRKEYPIMPVLMHSWEQDHKKLADDLDVQFANKADEELSDHVSEFMQRNFGFGDFEFRLPDGTFVDRAGSLEEMVEALERVPDESLGYHASHNHFSNWLMARSEFSLAGRLQPRRASEFPSVRAIREFLVGTLVRHFNMRQRGQVTEFPSRASLLSRDFIRIGKGSMGGKARGSAFLAHLLVNNPIGKRFEPDIHLVVPRSAVICADFFDLYTNQNDLRKRVMAAKSDEEVAELFLAQELPGDLMEALWRVVEQVHYPLAVRSSSLLEDVTIQPLAGLYDTYMLPNNDPDFQTRLHQLSRAIRLVMASAFYREARRHLRAHNFRPEREKMAVMVQRIVGRQHEQYFYPDFAGVAQSHNYYPMRYLKPEDGIAVVAMGMGHTVVEGRKALRFSPKHPQILPQMSTIREATQSSQRDFFALNLDSSAHSEGRNTGLSLSLLELSDAERHGTLEPLGATYCHQNNMIYDTIYREGARLVNFAGVLKFDRFPLATVLSEVLDACEEAMGAAVELEFAVTLNKDKPPEMALLELRPLSGVGNEDVDLKPYEARKDQLCHGKALGNGSMEDIHDIVYLHPDRMKLSTTRKLAKEIEKFNHKLSQQNRPYLLLGPGRWGTSDPWMGIPVVWSQVSGARTIVEMELTNSNVEPSLGTHFFHNLSTLRVGYFCLRSKGGVHNVDLDWLDSQPVVEESMGIRHVALQQPIEVHIDGRRGEGIVLKGPAE